MLRSIPNRTFLHWIVYSDLAPFSEERADLRAAMIAREIWNVQIAKTAKKGYPPQFRPLSDFMLRLGDLPDTTPRPTRKMSQEALWTNLRAMVKAYAKPKRKPLP